MADAPVHVGRRLVGARLVVAVHGQNQMAIWRLVHDGGRIDAFLLPNDPIPRVALRNEFVERVCGPGDRAGEHQHAAAAAVSRTGRRHSQTASRPSADANAIAARIVSVR